MGFISVVDNMKLVPILVKLVPVVLLSAASVVFSCLPSLSALLTSPLCIICQTPHLEANSEFEDSCKLRSEKNICMLFKGWIY